MRKVFTVFIIANSKKGTFKEFHISRARLWYGLAGLTFLGLLFSVFIADYFFSFSSHLHYQKYQAENKNLKKQLTHLHIKMKQLNSRLHQIEDFSHKIKVIAGLEQPSSAAALAMGPVPGFSFPNLSSSSSHIFSSLNLRQNKIPGSQTSNSLSFSDSALAGFSVSQDSIVVYMDRLRKKSQLTLQNLTLLMEQLHEKKDIISSTPSITPTKGWISSHFGYRQYPFTGEISLHEGMDIAASPGTPVYAPAAGKIMFAGYKQGYGNVIVVDHGYELSTLYGHLADIMVSQQQKVERGQVIGSIGSTGRSSGPHLHYEVRISNVPVDPANYILTEL